MFANFKAIEWHNRALSLFQISVSLNYAFCASSVYLLTIRDLCGGETIVEAESRARRTWKIVSRGGGRQRDDDRI